MKKHIYFILFLLVFFCCKKGNIPSSKNDSSERKTQDIIETSEKKLSFEYLVNSNFCQLQIEKINNKVLRVGKENDQSFFLRFNKEANPVELNIYNEIEWQFGAIVKDHKELSNGILLNLYNSENFEKFSCDLIITKEIPEENVLKVRFPKEYFKNEDDLDKYFIPKTELDSIMIKNPDYLNPLDDDPREYVPYYFKINKKANKNVFYVSSNNGLNLREKAITNSKIIRKLNFKEPVFVNDTISELTTISKTDGYWVKIEDVIGNKGVVFNAYLIK